MKIPFSPPDITEEEVEQVAEALRSGWITTGPKTKELERQVANFCGTSRAVCLNSQTACAEMTLRLLGVTEGDEVIVPAYTGKILMELIMKRYIISISCYHFMDSQKMHWRRLSLEHGSMIL